MIKRAEREAKREKTLLLSKFLKTKPVFAFLALHWYAAQIFLSLSRSLLLKTSLCLPRHPSIVYASERERRIGSGKKKRKTNTTGNNKKKKRNEESADGSKANTPTRSPREEQKEEKEEKASRSDVLHVLLPFKRQLERKKQSRKTERHPQKDGRIRVFFFFFSFFALYDRSRDPYSSSSTTPCS